MNKELKNILNRSTLPLIWLAFMWVLHISTTLFGMHDQLVRFAGLHTQRVDGLIGIFTAPFVHGDWSHLLSNSLPFLILGTAIFYFYPKIGARVFLFSWFVPQIFVWTIVAPSYHIGASGMVYAFAFFLFFSGVFRKEVRAIVLSLLVAFSYGSLVWGVLPIQEGVSWQGHLFGALVGIVLAWIFRNKGEWVKKEPSEEPDLYEPGIPYWDYKSLYPPPEGMSYPDEEE
ncbi:MAG: rhomboid family intramembrane serine protease [Bacteroidota bacterium]